MMATDSTVVESTPVSTETETQNKISEQAPTEAPTDEDSSSTDDETSPEETVETLAKKAAEAEASAKKLERELKKAHRVNSRLHQELSSKRDLPERTEESEQARSVEELAEYKSQVREYARVANQLVADGAKHFGGEIKYLEALDELKREVGGLITSNGLPTPFMSTLIEVADKPSDLLVHLAKNPDIAESLVDLSPLKLAKKLDRIEREMADSSKPKSSAAPKPLEPVKPIAKGQKNPEDMTFDEFTAWRLANGARRRS
jgi:hypothetical protein